MALQALGPLLRLLGSGAGRAAGAASAGQAGSSLISGLTRGSAATQILDLLSAFNGMTGALEVGARTISAAAKNLSKNLNEVVQIDQRLAVVNTGLEVGLDSNINALRDTTGGLMEATKALTELKVLGFKQSNKNLTDLATRLKASGQNTQAMFSLAQSLLGAGGITESGVDRFAKTVVNLSRDFGVTGDNIIGAVNKLSGELLDLNITGGVEGAAKFTAGLTAALGNENAKLAGDFARNLLSLQTNQNQLSIIGLEDFANQIRTGAIQQFDEAGNQALIRAGQQVRNFLGIQGDITARQLQALRPIVGDIGVQALRISQELEKGAPERTFGDRISQIVSVVRQKLLTPFNEAILRLQPVFKKFLQATFIAGAALLNVIALLEPIISKILEATTFVLTKFSFLSSVFEGVGDLTKAFGPEKFEKSFDQTVETFNQITKGTEINQARQETVSTRSMTLLENIKTNTQQSLSIDTTRLLNEERRDAIVLADRIDSEGLTGFQKQQMLVIDRLARSVQFQRGSDELEALRELITETRKIREEAEKPEAQPLPNVSHKQRR